MGLGRLLALGICALALLSSAVAVGNCNLGDLFASGTLENLVATVIARGDSPTNPTIVVHENRTVCLSVGELKRKFSSISVVVNYTCDGNANCPGGGSTGTAVEQFDFGCDTTWTIAQFANFQAAREENPSANFETTLRTDCAACFTQHSTMNASQSFLPFDPDTHCVDCSSECISVTPRQPAMCYQRFGLLNSSCCNVYFNGICQPFCPDKNYTLNSERECLLTCPQIIVANANVRYITSEPAQGNRYFEGTSATINCNSNYMVMGNGEVTCSNGGWGTLPTCTIIDCGRAPTLENGKVSESGTIVGSKATYQCNPDYVFTKNSVTERTCQVSGNWSNESIGCEGETKCPKVCQNGGTCLDGVCICPPGFTGADCEGETKCPKVCQNGGTCLDGVCICPPGFTGVDCADKVCPECESGSSCDAVTGQCVCPAGFSGSKCETCSISNCASTAIVNGACVCQKCEEEYTATDGNKICDSVSSSENKKFCLLCIILPIVAVILAIIIAIAIAVAIYVYRKWKEVPSTKLKEKEANGLNGVARDNPLYLDPSTVEEEVG